MVKKEPFTLSPEPQLLYETPLLQTAVHKIKYVIERRQGATAVLGDFGLGKSSLMRLILREYVAREDYAAIFIPTPTFKTDYGFLKAICKEFHIGPKRSLLDQQEALQSFVVQQFVEGRNVVLLIDEGQKLDYKMLEVLRTLLNFETDEAKLMQIVLAGQLELQERLSDKRNRALKSRIFAPTILSPLSLEETRGMIAFRSERAGIPNPFTPEAIDAIYAQTQGVPREVLSVCGMAYHLGRLAGLTEIPAEAIPMAKAEARLP